MDAAILSRIESGVAAKGTTAVVATSTSSSGDITSRTVENLRADPAVEANVVDPIAGSDCLQLPLERCDDRMAKSQRWQPWMQSPEVYSAALSVAKQALVSVWTRSVSAQP